MKMTKAGFLSILAVGAATFIIPGNGNLGIGSAFADTTYTINVPNSTLAPYTPPYAGVDVHLTDSTHATITFTSDTTSGKTFLMAGVSAADVNVNATTWTIGSFSASNSGSGFTPGPLSNSGSGTVDGFGLFNQRVDSFDGYTHSSDKISFVLHDTSGTWASSASVLTPDSKGFTVAIHGFVCNAPCTATEGALATGYAANGSAPPPRVPEPSTLLLLGSGLTGAGIWFRRKKA